MKCHKCGENLKAPWELEAWEIYLDQLRNNPNYDYGKGTGEA